MNRMINKDRFFCGVIAAGGDNLFVGNCFFRKLLCCILIFIGVILMLCFMPFWLWLALLGMILIVIGCFLLIRKC